MIANPLIASGYLLDDADTREGLVWAHNGHKEKTASV
jgi:hypothetical protein